MARMTYSCSSSPVSGAERRTEKVLCVLTHVPPRRFDVLNRTRFYGRWYRCYPDLRVLSSHFGMAQMGHFNLFEGGD